jgi:RNA polymerase sigma factor (sigma-70 family)
MLDSLTLLRALGRLTPNQREAFLDHVVLERTLAEISTSMGVSRGRVEQLVKDARDRLDYLRVYERAA